MEKVSALCPERLRGFEQDRRTFAFIDHRPIRLPGDAVRVDHELALRRFNVVEDRSEPITARQCSLVVPRRVCVRAVARPQLFSYPDKVAIVTLDCTDGGARTAEASRNAGELAAEEVGMAGTFWSVFTLQLTGHLPEVLAGFVPGFALGKDFFARKRGFNWLIVASILPRLRAL